MGLEDIVNDNQERIDKLEEFMQFILESKHIVTHGMHSMETGQIKAHYDKYLKEKKD